MGLALIGSIAFLRMSEVDKKRKNIEVFTRPNVDGAGIQDHGSAGRPRTYRCVRDVDAAGGTALNDEIDAVRALEGTVVTVLDNYARTFTKMAIVSVVVPPDDNRGNPQKVSGVAGGINGAAATYIIDYNITMVDLSV